MKVEFTGRHVEISAAIKKHAKEQLEKIEKVFDFDKLGKAHVILDVNKHRHRAEIIFTWRDHEMTAHAETNDMYTALGQAADRLERQALKLKGKKTTMKRHKASAATVAALPALAGSAPLASEPRIIRSRRYAIKPLTPEEAMMEVSQSIDQFLVFRDAETDHIAVIYKRKDGNFGLIEP
jgi:putative sigma-54 modulation protein